MTKVQLQNPTESEKIISREKEPLEREVIDADGKIYQLKVPGPVEEFDLNVALGAEHSTNLGLIVQVKPLLFIESINGVPFNFAGTFAGVRAALYVIGTNGMKAVTEAVVKYWKSENGEAKNGMSEEVKSDIKK